MKFSQLLFTVFLFRVTYPYEHLDIPDCDTNLIIHHSGYALQYSGKFKNPIWVSEILTNYKVSSVLTERKGTFKADPLLTNRTATSADYSHSGFDKGHMAPAADMKWSENAMVESFYMSNISPQTPGCNRGIWSRLEDQVRMFAEEYDTVYVFTGPILNDSLQKFNGITIPHYFYKICLTTKPFQAIGFLVPNTASKLSLQDFCVTVDSIEQLTKLNFFKELPDSIENRIESKFNVEFWFSSFRQSSLANK